MSGMPTSATATGLVDYVLPIEEMPAKLVAYSKHLLTVEPHKGADGTREDAVEHLAKICSLVRSKLGHDFGQYKEKTLVRRIQRRMQVPTPALAAAMAAAFQRALIEWNAIDVEVAVTLLTELPESVRVESAISARAAEHLATMSVKPSRHCSTCSTRLDKQGKAPPSAETGRATRRRQVRAGLRPPGSR